MDKIELLQNENKIMGTSFHGGIIISSVNNIQKSLGIEPHTDSLDDKVQYMWDLKYKDIPFSIYDWKEYRKIDPDEEIEFHIGTHTNQETDIIKNLLNQQYNLNVK